MNSNSGGGELPAAVIFDLDGTLVSSTLNFLSICEETGCAPGQDVLKYIETLPPNEQSRCHGIIYDHEMADAHSSELLAGVSGALAFLAKHGIYTGIVTRNSAEATRIKLARSGIDMKHVLTREDAPPKPAPDALLLLAERWNLQPEHCVYVGDFRYDIEAALNAKMHAGLYSVNDDAAYRDQAHFVFDHYDGFEDTLLGYWKEQSII